MGNPMFWLTLIMVCCALLPVAFLAAAGGFSNAKDLKP